nr:hypothetical protein [Tanacetum cinerariifolium]
MLRSRHARSISRSPEPRHGHSESPRKRGPERRTMFKRPENGVFHGLRDKGKGTSAYSNDSKHRSYHGNRRDTESCYQSSHSREMKFVYEKRHNKRTSSRRTKLLSESEGSSRGHWKSKPKRQRSSVKDDMSQPWVCEETDPFTLWICYFNFPKTRMPSHIKTYDESKDLEDHLKIVQAVAKTECWAMPTIPRKLPLAKKCIKDPVEIHNIKQKDGESTKEFVRRYKLECKDVKGALECMKIFGFMHGITNPELIKRLHDKKPKSVDKMMKVTTTFLKGKVAASNHERKTSFPSWKHQDVGHKHNFKKGGFRNQQRPKRKQDRFTLLTKTPKEILALDKGKFKPPLPMTTSAEKRNARKFYKFFGEVGHTIDECMHLKRQIKEMFKARKLSHLIKELKQSSRKYQAKATKKGKISGKDKPLAILMVQPWQRVAKQKITQIFSAESTISFPPLQEEDGMEGPMIIEAEMGGHFVHRMYVNRGSSSEILYEHCFNRFCPEVRSQMILATTPLVEFSREIIWPLWKILLLIKIGDEEHPTLAWMNFMIVRSPSPYKGIIRRPRVRRIQEISSTTHGMLKFPMTGETVTLQSSRIIPLECTMVSGPRIPRQTINQVAEEKIQVAIHPEYPEQTVAIGSTLTEVGLKELCGFLRRNLDIFSWKPTDMTRVPRHIAEHRLNILMVKKHDGSWRMCGDFKDLNKACPKDGYPLPKIDWKVESLYFIIEHPEDYHLDTLMDDKEELSDPWILFTDGSSCMDDFEAVLIITNLKGMKFTYALRFMFNATNNEAKYEALIAGLQIAKQMGVKNLQANVDSKLVANQVNRVYVAKEPGMIKYLDKVKNQAIAFKEFSIKQVPRGEKSRRTKQDGIYQLCLFKQAKKIILEEKRKSRAIHRKANYVLWEIQEGSCSMHPSPRSMVAKALRLGYYWPTINGETPFSLTYRAKAVISVEIGMPTLRTAKVDMIKNDEALGVNLDLLKEKSKEATIREARRKAKMEKYYNARVRGTSFRPGDLIYQNNEASHTKDGGKLGPKWEGPYEVTKALEKGAYKLRDHNRNTLPLTWKVCNLKKCYTHEM